MNPGLTDQPTLRKRRLAQAAMSLTIIVMLGSCAVVRRFEARIRVDRGDALLADDRLDDALIQFQRATELNPKLAVAHSRLGTVYERLGDYDRAIDRFIEAIRHNPFSFDDTLSLARLYQFMHRAINAIQAYLHAVELHPKDFEAQLNLGVCYQETGDAQQAAERFRKAIEIDPNRAPAYVNLGVALDSQQRYYEAVRAYKEALERNNRQPLVLVNLAHTYMKQNRLKIARATLTETIRMSPQLAPAHEALGYCLFRERKFDESENSYLQAIAYDWRLPRAHAGLGSINMLRFLGDRTLTDRRDRGLEDWHRSLELDPEQPRIRSLIAEYTPRQTDPEAKLFELSPDP